MHTALVISPHADDAAAFCGGTIAKWAAEGWRIVLVRVTDDARDSVGLPIEETLERNRLELHEAARILGCADIEELAFPTDTLADVPLGQLRERFVYLIRKHRPFAVFSFDPHGMFEGNQDHVRVAQAVEEAYWVACFDLHHREHFREGLAPFSVCERWYFARQLPVSNHAEDITDYFEVKLRALGAHRTMMRNVLNQSRLQLATWGRRMPLLDAAIDGDMRPMLELVMGEQARAAAAAAGLHEGALAEPFRLVRFGDLEPLFQSASEAIPGTSPAPERPALDM